MGRMASPAALSRTLSLQRANARAKSCRAESCSDKKAAGTGLSKRVDALLTSISSTEICIEDTQIHPCKKADDDDDDDDDGSPSAIKRSFSDDFSSRYTACFSSLSERIDRGLDLWDREFSSMSSYASDRDGYICGLQRRLNSGSLVCDSKDACSKSSWSEESLADALEMEEEAASSNASSNGMSTDCRGGSYSYVANHKLQGDDRLCNLQGFGNHKLQAKEVKYVGIIDSTDRVSRGAAAAGNRDLIQGSHGSCRISSRGAKCGKGDDANNNNIRSVEEKATELPPNSVAVEKVSVNPVEDFRESMYEMMMEKDMEEESGDMEDLLDCYLLLNPSELHDVIREAFSHVWIDIIMTIR